MKHWVDQLQSYTALPETAQSNAWKAFAEYRSAAEAVETPYKLLMTMLSELVSELRVRAALEALARSLFERPSCMRSRSPRWGRSRVRSSSVLAACAACRRAGGAGAFALRAS